ncbi:Anaphase-promoting complex subunit 2 [Cyphellophora attinorum]|uniref:Anaphase-promoting complex subunit 2 n=1 Tax=Cyphellophora attinorum TaxID=1664694 RepID=A0A0N0NRW3_9EURO|nr:Anaphase-promoting complex subunit 2 [Phialophora attinorum]KPI45558.1 Anaphase-promoting complex subunit 2 [Phialophora attinorum]
MAKVMSTPGRTATNDYVAKKVFNDYRPLWKRSRPRDIGTVRPNAADDVDDADTGNIDQIRAELQAKFEFILGIGSSLYVYGWDQVSDGEPYRLPLSQCPSMHDVRPSSPEEAAAHYQKLLQSDIWQTLSNLRKTLGIQRVVRMVSEILHSSVKSYVRWAYSGVYRMDVADHLRFWVENILSLITTMAQIALTGGNTTKQGEDSWLATSESQSVDRALTTLGALRIDEMYNIIAGQHKPEPIIEDLKHYVTCTRTRTFLVDSFNGQLTINVLHPGASTIEILRIYISTIRFFRKLDPKGVLLDRVARRVRQYLRERDDAVKVVVSGLLSDPSSQSQDSEILTELATELHQPYQSYDVDLYELGWNNMEWVPDPADATPDHLKSRNNDVIGSLTSLFESKEVFVKELQAVFAERLLENKTNNFDLEVVILNHLKQRLGDSSLQSCEVMLRDVLESVKIDAAINKTNKNADVHAKILSRLFWPAMSEQAFEMAPEISGRQMMYENGFEKYKSSRKLTWVQSLGQVEVELQLEDRVVRESVLPYQATVIYAFQDRDGTGSPVTRTVADLANELSMLVPLARSACIFWLSKRVLAETSPDTFTVLERNPDSGDDVIMSGGAEMKPDASAAAAEAAAARAAQEAEEEERKQKMVVYHQFIVSMLTNQGAMPLARIAMMLNMVVPGGFPFNNEELKEFLTGMVKEGQLQVGPGGNYKARA